MTLAVFHKLLAIFLTVALGWVAGRMRWLGGAGGPTDAARVLGNAAFHVFVPALLFRTTVRLDFATLPWHTLAAFFVPVLGVLIAVYLWPRGSGERHGAAAPSVRAVAGVFGNSVQVGIPVAAALFGEAGLAIHIALVSLHAIVLLTVLTVLAETDVARARARREAAPSLARTLAGMLRNTIVHPVVLPVIAGMAWNAKRTSLETWGQAPTTIEPVRGTLRIKNLSPARGLTMQPLDGAGRPMGSPLTAQKDRDHWILPLGEPPTTWALLSVER